MLFANKFQAIANQSNELKHTSPPTLGETKETLKCLKIST